MNTLQLSKKLDSVIEQLTQTSNDFAIEAIIEQTPLKQAQMLAVAYSMYKDLLTKEVMYALFMPHMNTPLGFDTDRNPKKSKNTTPYDWETVRDAVIESLIHGLAPVGNEWAIISGRLYIAQPGMRKKCVNFPGVNNLRVILGVHQPSHDGSCAFVPATVTWEQDGELCELVLAKTEARDERIIVVKNDYMGPDAIRGKAERKALHAAFKVMQAKKGFSIPSILQADDEMAVVDVPLIEEREPGQEG